MLDLDRCIVDLRNNDGGQPVWVDLLDYLREHEVFNRDSHLFVLIGRRTFSSAVIFATRLQLQTRAILIGEPTGQGPVFYSRPNIIELPHSRLPFSISRYLTVAGLSFDRRKAILPDIPVVYSISDFISGTDPVLQAALSYTLPVKPAFTSQSQNLERCTGRYLLTPEQVMDISVAGDHLRLKFMDFMESGGLLFQSDLSPVSDHEFSTHIKGVTVVFPKVHHHGNDPIYLNWMGVPHLLSPAPENHVSAFEKFAQGEITAGCEALMAKKQAYLSAYPDLEPIINRLGYIHLRKGDVSAARQIFHLNVDLFPRSYNVYDSYGEALMVDNQIEAAIQNYQRSLELNPENKNAERVIKHLTRLL
jgi:hypothetical protein